MIARTIDASSRSCTVMAIRAAKIRIRSRGLRKRSRKRRMKLCRLRSRRVFQPLRLNLSVASEALSPCGPLPRARMISLAERLQYASPRLNGSIISYQLRILCTRKNHESSKFYQSHGFVPIFIVYTNLFPGKHFHQRLLLEKRESTTIMNRPRE